jgi:hypothetical protein
MPTTQTEVNTTPTVVLKLTLLVLPLLNTQLTLPAVYRSTTSMLMVLQLTHPMPKALLILAPDHGGLLLNPPGLQLGHRCTTQLCLPPTSSYTASRSQCMTKLLACFQERLWSHTTPLIVSHCSLFALSLSRCCTLISFSSCF